MLSALLYAHAPHQGFADNIFETATSLSPSGLLLPRERIHPTAFVLQDRPPIQQHIYISTVVILQVKTRIRHTICAIGANRDVPESLDFPLGWHLSDFWCDRQSYPIQIIAPAYLAGKPRVRLSLAALTLKCGNLKIRLWFEHAEPRLLNEYMAGGALA